MRYAIVVTTGGCLAMLHATRAGLDQIIVLARAADGSYHGLLAELPPGHWYVQVEADNRCGRIDAHSG